jgi:hypothetical protein
VNAILPNIEQQALYNAYNYGGTLWRPYGQTQTVTASVPLSFFCKQSHNRRLLT